jgi:hypothetical protein
MSEAGGRHGQFGRGTGPGDPCGPGGPPDSRMPKKGLFGEEEVLAPLVVAAA